MPLWLDHPPDPRLLPIILIVIGTAGALGVVAAWARWITEADPRQYGYRRVHAVVGSVGAIAATGWAAVLCSAAYLWPGLITIAAGLVIGVAGFLGIFAWVARARRYGLALLDRAAEPEPAEPVDLWPHRRSA